MKADSRPCNSIALGLCSKSIVVAFLSPSGKTIHFGAHSSTPADRAGSLRWDAQPRRSVLRRVADSAFERIDGDLLRRKDIVADGAPAFQTGLNQEEGNAG
jgi:hypothetical protein